MRIAWALQTLEHTTTSCHLFGRIRRIKLGRPARTVSTTSSLLARMAPKLHGRAFYESIGSPKHVVAPMVDQSEFAWRLLTRSFLPSDLRTSILCYSPMLHAKMFADGPKYRQAHFEPVKAPISPPQPGGDNGHASTIRSEDLYLDGNPNIGDRPLFVQFCANDPDALLEAAKIVQPYCDAVDLNLGCPQGIARRGNYGAFLQDDWNTIYKLINTLHKGLDIPVTAKMRILETKERTLEYAKTLLSAGASIITVHGRQREQKGHNTGLADWSVLKYLREQLPPETVMFANGNILQRDDLPGCLEETGADGVMSAEGNLYDPSIFAEPPAVGEEGREYWRGRDGKGGYRTDAVLRRYLDIIHRHVLGQHPPERKPLFLASDLPSVETTQSNKTKIDPNDVESDGAPVAKKQKREAIKKEGKTGKHEKCTNANLVAMQAHCFHILRPLVSKHHNVRDALARSRAGDVDAYENVLTLTEKAVAEGLRAYAANPADFEATDLQPDTNDQPATECSDEAVRRCKRPYWVCQPYIRPLPKEALEKGSMQLSKKDMKKLEKQEEEAKKVGLAPEGKVESVPVSEQEVHSEEAETESMPHVQVPREGLVCG